MSTVLSPPEARVLLHNISWSLYEQLLTEHEDKSSPRFAYDRGELEITGDGLVRYAAGIEDTDDLLTDVERAAQSLSMSRRAVLDRHDGDCSWEAKLHLIQ